ncbi:MAG: hypothetical protein [Olavius algarvensis Gamma 1 endosymbiont]|nr:MAG: hypothetical protein [Olavius algarvensis Gamma 1 endosymbiont]
MFPPKTTNPTGNLCLYNRNATSPVSVPSFRGCLGTHFRNSLKIGRLDKINPLF